MAGDAVVGPEQRPERRCRVAQLEHELDLLGHSHAKPTVLDGKREPIEAHVDGLLTDAPGDRVALLDRRLFRDYLGAHELPYRAHHVLQVVVLHNSSPGQMHYTPARATFSKMAVIP